ncbi:hypothetical protein SAMN04515647_2410 [Cohaesibacter sp. ES.047]|uniref:hypothetical protein n=1 Tax=Cohaesibacter sp. ES.047 TaxID=1798205 RepID=UPI000BB7418A|nr:hypothetical protein [Cohaesibacter sp. ES.047]SNY92165.1 hypothetical protein SAMN04515647_2410 [Cohaesibacter sp. ES.047]
MTTPVTATHSIAASDPVDLSRITQDFGSFRPETSHHATQADARWTTRATNPGVADAPSIDFGFSLEDIPLVGDFLSMVSSLFHTQPSGLDGNRMAQDSTPPPPSQLHASAQQPEALKSTSGDSALDLSRLLKLDTMAGIDPTTTTKTASIEATRDGDSNLDALKPALPAVSGLVHHPSNRLPAETLQLLQERYLKQFPQEG